jgi:hypothetical protein
MIKPHQGMSPFQLEQLRKKLTYERATAKTPMVGSGKGVKIQALSKIIPAKKIDEIEKNFINTIIPLMPPALLELEDERQYLVPKTLFDVLVSDEDIDNWNSLLSKFNDLLGNLTKVLNNIRKINYHKIVTDKLLEQEISNRKIKVTEKLLEKDDEEEKKAKNGLLSGVNIDDLSTVLMAAGFALTNRGNNNAPPAASDFIQIANTLKSKYGLQDFQAAAIVGTWMQEGLGKGRPDDIEDAYAYQYGDFGPPPIGSTKVGYGWAQWTNMAPGGRLDRVCNGIGVTDRAWTNNDNLRAFDWELQNSFPSLMRALKGTQDIDEAVQLFVHIYEAGGNIQNFVNMHGQSFLPRRVQSANSVLNGMTKPNAAGGIILPKLMDQYNLWYNTDDKTSDISKFIVDRPTIIDVQSIGEPLIVIPTERPIGHEVLSILFKEPFRKIEKIFERREQEAKPQTPIENNTTSINRTTIPQSEKPKRKSQNSSIPTQDPVNTFTLDNEGSINMMSLGVHQNEFLSVVTDFNNALSKSLSQDRLASIHTVSQTTQSFLSTKVILLKQDIYATQEE